MTAWRGREGYRSLPDGGRSASHIESKILLQEIRDCLEAHAAGPNLARDCAIFWLYYAQGYTAKAHRSASVNQAFSEGVESTIHVLYAKG